MIGTKAFEGGGVGGKDFEGRRGCAFGGLARSIGAVREGGADVAYGGEGHTGVMVAG